MKIEMEVKELATLLDYIREQRESVGDPNKLAKELVERLPQNVVERLNHRT